MSISSIGSSNSLDLTSLYTSLFNKVDTDGNGSVDKTEFSNAVSTMLTDQSVSTDDVDAMFKKLDTDGNGTVSSSEMISALKTMGENMRPHMPPPPPDGASGAQDQTLTDDQKKTVDSILSQYDASNLTADNVKAINNAISSAGISFGKALGDEIESQGFSIQKMMSLSTPPTNSDADGTSGTDATNALFSNLVDSLESTSSTSDTGSTNALFASLIDSLSSSNGSDTKSAFSNLIDDLSANSNTDKNDLSSLFSSLITELQSGTSYSQNGSLSVNASTTQSLLSMFA